MPIVNHSDFSSPVSEPELIRGIDIDRKLVERARKNSRASQRSACMENEYAEALEALGHPSFLPLSFKSGANPLPLQCFGWVHA